jgi:hypothetical protein
MFDSFDSRVIIYEEMLKFIADSNNSQYDKCSINYEKSYKEYEKLVLYHSPPIPIPKKNIFYKSYKS